MSAYKPLPSNKEEEGFPIRPRSRSGDSISLSKLNKISPLHDNSGWEEESTQNGSDSRDRETLKAKDFNHRRTNGHVDDADLHRTLKGPESRNLKRRSRSLEDILTCQESSEFCLLSYTEPDDIDTGGEYTMIVDECEYLSDEGDVEQSTEVKDLTPLGSCLGGERTDMAAAACVTPPRATEVLINAFLRRIESVMVNGVYYPPGLFFVQ
jgi:hypothetical protein